TQQGLPDDVVPSIVADRDGTMWFGTRRGLSRLKDGLLRTFTTSDGLPDNTVEKGLRDANGVLWIGTPQGVAQLTDERFEPINIPPHTRSHPMGSDRE